MLSQGRKKYAKIFLVQNLIANYLKWDRGAGEFKYGKLLCINLCEGYGPYVEEIKIIQYPGGCPEEIPHPKGEIIH